MRRTKLSTDDIVGHIDTVGAANVVINKLSDKFLFTSPVYWTVEEVAEYLMEPLYDGVFGYYNNKKIISEDFGEFWNEAYQIVVESVKQQLTGNGEWDYAVVDYVWENGQDFFAWGDTFMDTAFADLVKHYNDDLTMKAIGVLK